MGLFDDENGSCREFIQELKLELYVHLYVHLPLLFPLPEGESRT